MQEDEKVGDQALEKLRNTVAEEHKDQLNEKDRELLRIKTENEKLRKEQSNIETKILNPDEATIKSSAENQELEKAKDYYLSKNIEIE